MNISNNPTTALSSGLRINSAADDAAGLAISEKTRAQVRGLDTASRNASDSVSLIQTGEGALSGTHSILQRMRELAIQSNNGTYTDADRRALQTEFNQLQSEITRIGNTTEFNTMNILDGSANNNPLTFQIGANSGQTTSLSIGDMRAIALGIGGLDINTQSGAASALEALDGAIQGVSSQRNTLGAMQNRLEYTINNLNTASENQQAAESRIRDANMAREIIKHTTDNIRTQVSLAMTAQANVAQTNVLRLLG